MLETIKSNCTNQLNELHKMVSSLSNDQYSMVYENQFKSSTGKHLRHVIEYYLALITVVKSDSNLISYDNRRRDVFLEEDRIQMMCKIHQLISVIDSIDNDVEITLSADISPSANQLNGEFLMKTSLKRELLYCFDHGIHHLAIMKVYLAQLGVILDSNLGVAPSTLRNQSTICAH